MTKAEQRWAFQHAKSHVLESIEDVMIDENHSVIKMDGKPRPDIQAEVERCLKQFKRLACSAKIADFAEASK